jgi:hypothetical protein
VTKHAASQHSTVRPVHGWSEAGKRCVELTATGCAALCPGNGPNLAHAVEVPMSVGLVDQSKYGMLIGGVPGARTALSANSISNSCFGGAGSKEGEEDETTCQRRARDVRRGAERGASHSPSRGARGGSPRRGAAQECRESAGTVPTGPPVAGRRLLPRTPSARPPSCP